MNGGIDPEIRSLYGGPHPVARREFLRASLGTGFALAVLPVSAQTITTSAEGLRAGEVKVPVKDGQIPAYRAMPSTGSGFPTVLVVQEIFGVHEWIKDVVRRLAKQGYYAIAPELYARQGDPTKIADVNELMQQIVSKVPDAQVMSDLDATAAYARSTGQANADKLGITGFCWGGRVVWMYAGHNPNLRAGVAWYGPLVRSYYPGDKSAIDLVPNIKAAMLGLYGGQDPGIPNDTVEKMRDAMKAAGKTAEVVIYPDAPHGFLADYRPSYRKDAAEQGWKRLSDWFTRYLA